MKCNRIIAAGRLLRLPSSPNFWCCFQTELNRTQPNSTELGRTPAGRAVVCSVSAGTRPVAFSCPPSTSTAIIIVRLFFSYSAFHINLQTVKLSARLKMPRLPGVYPGRGNSAPTITHTMRPLLIYSKEQRTMFITVFRVVFSSALCSSQCSALCSMFSSMFTEHQPMQRLANSSCVRTIYIITF